MRADVLQLALMAGGLTYLWRFLPLRISLSDMPQDGLLSRFLSATGPAAISTLFVAEMLPLMHGMQAAQGRAGVGVLAVILAFAWRKSVVFAMLAGACACGMAVALGQAQVL